MAQRNAVQRLDTSPVMGEGSFVMYRPMQVGDMEQLLSTISADTPPAQQLAGARAIVAQTVVEWDWVDDAGELLPSPAVDPEVTKRLYAHELMFIVRNIQTGVEEREETKKK